MRLPSIWLNRSKSTKCTFLLGRKATSATNSHVDFVLDGSVRESSNRGVGISGRDVKVELQPVKALPDDRFGGIVVGYEGLALALIKVRTGVTITVDADLATIFPAEKLVDGQVDKFPDGSLRVADGPSESGEELRHVIGEPLEIGGSSPTRPGSGSSICSLVGPLNASPTLASVSSVMMFYGKFPLTR
ncbi:hypothetical protein [Halarchaeum salinum]|uniref:hypothetical protein n=1 Tax=Halarchaeum salinum TaxID=489912 RepID=UPI001B85F0A3